MIESAQSMLAGLFPPQQHEIWEPNGLNWQPIGKSFNNFKYVLVKCME